MLHEQWKNIRRIVAMRLDNIGDVVLLSPALRALRNAFPDSHMTLLASPAGSQAAPLLPWINDVMVLSAVWQDASNEIPLDPKREREWIEQLWSRKFDAAFIFTSFSQSPYPPAFASYLAGIPIRVGQSKEFGGSILSHWVPAVPDTVHQAERNLHMLQSVGIPAASKQLELHIPPSARESAANKLRAIGNQEYMILAPGASCSARRYDPERYAEIVRRLVNGTNLRIVMVGSEREQHRFPTIEQAGGERLLSVVGKLTIAELAAVIERARLVVANDSGPMHIADAFGCPMVILFSGTEYESQWRPRNSRCVLLRKPTGCSPCYAFTCRYDMECLDIPASAVMDEITHILETTSAQGRAGTSDDEYEGTYEEEGRNHSCVQFAY